MSTDNSTFTSPRGGYYLHEPPMCENPSSAYRISRSGYGPDDAEHAIRANLSAGDCAGAVANTLAVYGREIFGFVSAAIAEPQPGRDAYARFVDALLRELPRFTWRCRLRTFVYFLACWQLRRMRTGSPLAAISIDTRWTLHTPRHRSPRSVVAAVRRSLAPEDRELLVLRFDRGFAWREIALTSLGEHATERAILEKSAELNQRLLILRMQIERLTRRAAPPRAVWLA
jgi:hypothetical protein